MRCSLGSRFEESKSVEDYKVTVDDMKLVLDRNAKINEQKKLKIQVSNMEVE